MVSTCPSYVPPKMCALVTQAPALIPAKLLRVKLNPQQVENAIRRIRSLIPIYLKEV